MGLRSLQEKIPRSRTARIALAVSGLLLFVTIVKAATDTPTENQPPFGSAPTVARAQLPTNSPTPTPPEVLGEVQTAQTTIIPTSTPDPDVAQFYPVIKVVDGDTIAVEVNGQSETLRLIGIDTPEVVDPRKPVQCFGREASAKAKELLDGQKVRLEADSSQGERDKYDRLLRYVFLENGTHFNQLMIEEGYAFEYTYRTPYRHQAEFKQAEEEARKNKRGLWADSACAGGVEPPTNRPQPTTSSTITSAPPTNPPTSTSKPTPISQPQTGACQYNCSGPDKDCSDFATHDEAVMFWNCCGFSYDNDPMQLDSLGEGDGIPCESLP